MNIKEKLQKMNLEEKDSYLRKVIYENVFHKASGALGISTRYCKQAAWLLGGDYDTLNSVQKTIFRAFITQEQIYFHNRFDYFTKYV